MIRAYTLKKELDSSTQDLVRLVVHHKGILDKGILIHDDEVYHVALSKISEWREATPTEASLYLAQAEVKPVPSRDLAKEIDGIKDRLETVELKAETLEVQSIGIKEVL